MRTLLLFSSLLAVTSCAMQATGAESGDLQPYEVTAADAAAPIELRMGQLLIVRLDANPSTGYNWEWDRNGAAEVLAQEGQPAMSGLDPQRVGGGGLQTWRFRAVAPGATELRLNYRRPWEADKAPVRSASWQIIVR